jgi:hypothetical protein
MAESMPKMATTIINSIMENPWLGPSGAGRRPAWIRAAGAAMSVNSAGFNGLLMSWVQFSFSLKAGFDARMGFNNRPVASYKNYSLKISYQFFLVVCEALNSGIRGFGNNGTIMGSFP